MSVPGGEKQMALAPEYNIRLLEAQIKSITNVIDNADKLGYSDYVKRSAYPIFYEYQRQLSIEYNRQKSESI
jgi:hypothetical protein